MPIDKYFARVSQQTFTAEELVGKTLAFYENGTEDSVTLTSELITIGTNYSIIKPSINGFSYVVVANENVSISGTNFTKGTWFLRTGGLTESPYSYAKSLTGVVITKSEEVITKIDKKFIPITVSSSGVTDGTNTFNASNKQNTLVSGTNIKTINGSTILGGGDMTVGGGTQLYKHTATYSDGTFYIISNRSSGYGHYSDIIDDYYNMLSFKAVHNPFGEVILTGECLGYADVGEEGEEETNFYFQQINGQLLTISVYDFEEMADTVIEL